MKKIWIVPVIILFASCSKESNTTTNYNPCNNIVAVIDNSYYSTDTTAIITYDAQGRVKTVKGDGPEIATYNYYSDHIDLIGEDVFGNNMNITYKLDKMQRVTGTYGADSDYVYNAEGYLSSYRAYYSSGQTFSYDTYNLTYDSGNLATVYDVTEPATPIKTFTYYNEPNQDLMGYNSPLYLANIIWDRNTFYLIKGGFFGKQSKKLLNAIDFHETYSGGVYLTYENDKQGRIITIPGGYSFVYQCP